MREIDEEFATRIVRIDGEWTALVFDLDAGEWKPLRRGEESPAEHLPSFLACRQAQPNSTLGRAFDLCRRLARGLRRFQKRE